MTSAPGFGAGFMTGIPDRRAMRCAMEGRTPPACGILNVTFRVSLECSCEDHVDNRPARIDWKFKQRCGSLQSDLFKAGGRGGVEEDLRAPLIEFGEDWLKLRVAQITTFGIGFDDHTVELELVESIANLRNTFTDMR